jgi:Zn-dependent protease
MQPTPPEEGQPPHTAPAEAPTAPSGAGGLLRGGLIAIAFALLSKGKVLLVAVKALPFGKLLLTGGSMAASVLAYSLNGGVAFAFGLVLMILVHELGHGAAMRQAGVAAGWPVFIPFFGAMIAMKGQPQHPRVEATIAYAGPLAGTAAALAAAGLGLWLKSPFFLALSYTGFFLNLFNLVPFGFLDGGRIARVLSRKSWIAGALLLVGLFWITPSPQLLLIAVMGAMHAFRRDDSGLGEVTVEDRRTWALRYFGLCAFLSAGVLFSHELTKTHGW